MSGNLAHLLQTLNRQLYQAVFFSEGCFASLKDQRGHRRLRHYEREKCPAEIYREVLGHNLRKLARKPERENICTFVAGEKKDKEKQMYLLNMRFG